jgi:hypothetical protein
MAMEIPQMMEMDVGVAACGAGLMVITMVGLPAMAQDAPTVLQQLDSTRDEVVNQATFQTRAPVSREKVDCASSGKKAAFAASSAFPLALDPAGGGACDGAANPLILAVTIEKGKKKRVLAIEGT